MLWLIFKNDKPFVIPAERERVYHCLTCGHNYPLENNFCPWCKSGKRMKCEEERAAILSLQNSVEPNVAEIRCEDYFRMKGAIPK